MNKGKSSKVRSASPSDAASRLTAPRSHAAPKAPKGANGETGYVGTKRKVFILRRHNLSSNQ